MVEIKRLFIQVFWDYTRLFTPREKMAIVRAISELEPRINFLDITSRQAVFKHVEDGDISTASVEIKVGCNWIQVSAVDRDTTFRITKILQEAIDKAYEGEEP